MRSFALSALIPLAFGIFASAAPTPHAVGDGGLIVVDAGVEVGRRGSGGGGFGGGSGSSSGGGSGGKNGLITADVDLDVLGLITADVDLDVLRREVKSDDALIDLNAKVKVGRRDDEKTLDSILCGVVSSVDALVEKICQSFPPSPLSRSLPDLLSQLQFRRVYRGNFGSHPQ